MTKIIFIGMLMIMIVGGGITYFGGDSNVVEVWKAETIEKIVEVEPDWASDPDAVKAAQDVIRKKELEAELEDVNTQIETLLERQESLEKELGTY